MKVVSVFKFRLKANNNRQAKMKDFAGGCRFYLYLWRIGRTEARLKDNVCVLSLQESPSLGIGCGYVTEGRLCAMEYVNTTGSGKGNAHYSAGVIHNGLLYVSGQLSVDPATGAVPSGGVAVETRQALANLEAVLTAANVSKTDVIQCRVYTPDVAYWSEINTVYANFFGDHKPARCVVPTTQLHYGCLVEIEAVAAIR